MDPHTQDQASDSESGLRIEEHDYKAILITILFVRRLMFVITL